MEENYQSQMIREEVGIGTCLSLIVAAFVIYSCMEVSGALDRVSHGLKSYLTQPIISQQETQSSEEAQRSQGSELTNFVND